MNNVGVVTGGASGLGAAELRRMAEEGARVVLTDVNERHGLAVASATAAELVAQDVSEEGSWPRLIEVVMRRYGRLDVLVNNAGIAIAEDIEEAATADWRRTIAVSRGADGSYISRPRVGNANSPR